jgi:SLT domain-containing protein
MAAFDTENQKALFHSYLWRLNIGAEHQGNGYGRFAVEALCQEAMRRGNHRLTVSYHPYQHGPEGFYRRLGFWPTGEYNEDEVVAERMPSSARRRSPAKPISTAAAASTAANDKRASQRAFIAPPRLSPRPGHRAVPAR